MIDDEADFGSIADTPEEVQAAAKFRPKGRAKPRKTSLPTKSPARHPAGETADEKVPQDTEDNSHREGLNDDLSQKSDQEAITVLDTWPTQDVDSTVDDTHAELINPHPEDSVSIFGEPSAEARTKCQPNVRGKKGKAKSVSFVLPNVSEGEVAPTGTNSEMGNISHCSDENLISLPKQTVEKLCVTEEQHSNDQEYTDTDSQYHEREPLDHDVEQHPNLDAEVTGTSMRLRSREKSHKVGISELTAYDNLDEDFVEASAAEQDNDSGDEYTAGGNQRARSRERPLRGSKHTSKDLSVEESKQKKLEKNKNEVASRGRKRKLKDSSVEQPEDSSVEQPEKKLTHRIRQKRMKEVKTLLETPDHEIDPMKLSVTHLRLLQEARERIKSNQIPSGPSSFNQSSELGDMDDAHDFGDDEQVNDGNERPASHVSENATKLNYHSYMSRQTRAKWSKSDTDLFYQGIRQFGSDFAMIQHLFPDKTRDQVRQKFKSEEKKHPMQVHDAIMHRSRDNLYFKKVMKQLNIEDVQLEITNAHKQDGASAEGDPVDENMLGDFGNEEEDNGSICSDKEQDMHRSEDKEQDMHRSEVKETGHVSENVDDELDDVFDWY